MKTLIQLKLTPAAILALVFYAFNVEGQIAKADYVRSTGYNIDEVRVILKSGERVRGKIVAADENRLVIKKKGKDLFTEIESSSIEAIHIRGRGAVATGVVLGALIGGYAGYLHGKEEQSKQAMFSMVTPESSAVSYGIIGGLVGGIIFSYKPKNQIGGSKEKFAAFVKKLDLTRK